MSSDESLNEGLSELVEKVDGLETALVNAGLYQPERRMMVYGRGWRADLENDYVGGYTTDGVNWQTVGRTVRSRPVAAFRRVSDVDWFSCGDDDLDDSADNWSEPGVTLDQLRDFVEHTSAVYRDQGWRNLSAAVRSYPTVTRTGSPLMLTYIDSEVFTLDEPREYYHTPMGLKLWRQGLEQTFASPSVDGHQPFRLRLSKTAAIGVPEVRITAIRDLPGGVVQCTIHTSPTANELYQFAGETASWFYRAWRALDCPESLYMSLHRVPNYEPVSPDQPAIGQRAGQIVNYVVAERGEAVTTPADNVTHRLSWSEERGVWLTDTGAYFCHDGLDALLSFPLNKDRVYDVHIWPRRERGRPSPIVIEAPMDGTWFINGSAVSLSGPGDDALKAAHDALGNPPMMFARAVEREDLRTLEQRRADSFRKQSATIVVVEQYGGHAVFAERPMMARNSTTADETGPRARARIAWFPDAAAAESCAAVIRTAQAGTITLSP